MPIFRPFEPLTRGIQWLGHHSHDVNADDNQKEPVKVHDKRRFNPDGSPKDSADDSGSATVDEVRDGAADALNREVEGLQLELSAARKRIDDLARAYQASERDREEFKARSIREREQLLDVERGKVAERALLEVIDQLDLCLANAGDSDLAKGVRMIRSNVIRAWQPAVSLPCTRTGLLQPKHCRSG